MLVVVAIAALVLSFLLQRRAEAKIRENEKSLHQQQNEMDRIAAEDQAVWKGVTRPDQLNGGNVGPTDYTAELAQLRAKAAELRAREIQLSNQQWSSRLLAGVNLLSIGNSNLLEHNKTLEATMNGGPRPTNGKLNDARGFANALMHYAADHEGFFPSTFDQVAAFLPRPLTSSSPPWDNAPISGTNDFEIVYQGALNELRSIPVGRIALLRERQPWLTPDGKWGRTYAYADGGAEIVVSDDNFQSWDAVHIVPPPTSP